MTAMETPQRRLRLWHWLVAIVVILLLALAFGIQFWLHSTADIDAFQVRAKARGIATTWEEVAENRSYDPARAAWFNELIDKVDNVQAWVEVDASNEIVSGEPLPVGLRQHHESLGPEFWPQVSELVRQLDGQPVVLHRTITFSTPMSELGAMRRLIKLSREAWLLGLIDADTVIDLPELLEPAVLVASLTRASMREVALGALVQRSPMTLSDRARARLQVWADSAHKDISHAFQHELILTVSGIREIAPGGSDVTSLDSIGKGGLVNALIFRWSRPASLEFFAEQVLAAATGPGLAEQAVAFQQLTERMAFLSQGLDRYRYALAHFLMSPGGKTQRRSFINALISRLVLYELGYGPWPDDPFAPSGTPLRRHERDGVVIGAWSVGLDGIDGGGARGSDDIRIELRPPWDAPKPSP